MNNLIYLDYMATTPVDPRVIEKMLPFLGKEGDFGNPASSTHAFGWRAKAAVECAREQVAQLIGADPTEVIWTSGATEAINLALLGAAKSYAHKGKHLVTSKTEHKAVLDTCKALEQSGFQITYLDPLPSGLLSLDAIAAAITDQTILLSVMLVNNEIGVIQDIASIAELAKEKGILFHVDAAQAVGKIPIQLNQWPVDLMSFSGHKVYGPKGMGALFVRRRPRVRLAPQIHGGGHEQGLRSGTLPTHQIVGMGEAFALAERDMANDNQRISALHHQLWQPLSCLPKVTLNGDPWLRVPHNLNICFRGVDAEALMMAVPALAISSGSACNSMLTQASYVLKAIGLSDEEAFSSVRITLGRYTTAAEIDIAVNLITQQVARLRELSPVWDRIKSCN